MFAIVQTGGKQYKIAEGDTLTVERLQGEVGETVTLDQVLALGGDKLQVGAPQLTGASVSAEIMRQAKGDKVIVFKKKRRHNYRRKLGHRQLQTTLRITGIQTEGSKKSAASKSTAKTADKPAEEVKAAPSKKADTKTKSASTAPKTRKKPAVKKSAAASKQSKNTKES